MEIRRLDGTDRKLYELVAPLVMDPLILKQNNNYPFKTSSRHIWYIAFEGDDIIGFMPVKSSSSSLCIDNYYIKDDREDTISAILYRIEEDTAPSSLLTALVHKRHVAAFTKNCFRTWIEWKNYEKMDYNPLLKKNGKTA